MLEVRYNKATGEVTGWWAMRHGNHKAKLKNKPDDVIIMLDIPAPDKSITAYLFNGDKLIANPNYVEPAPPRDLKAEIDELRAGLDKLSPQGGN